MAKVLKAGISITADTRMPGQAGLVIADVPFDDGVTWQQVFEGLPDEDPIDRLAQRIPDFEAQRDAEIVAIADAAIFASANSKLDKYVSTVDPTILAAAGMTPEEIQKIKEQATAQTASDVVVAFAELKI